MGDNCVLCFNWCYGIEDYTETDLCCVCKIKHEGKEFSGCCACGERVIKLVKYLSRQMELTRFIQVKRSFICWVCNDREIEGKKNFINHINEVHRRPNNKLDLTEEEADRIAEMHYLKPNMKKVKAFGEEFYLTII